MQSGSIVGALLDRADNDASNITYRLFVYNTCKRTLRFPTGESERITIGGILGSWFPNRAHGYLKTSRIDIDLTVLRRTRYDVSYSLVSWQAARSRTSMIWSTHCIFWECESVSGSLSLAWYCKCKFTMRFRMRIAFFKAIGLKATPAARFNAFWRAAARALKRQNVNKTVLALRCTALHCTVHRRRRWMHFRFVIYPGHFVLLLPRRSNTSRRGRGEGGGGGGRARHNPIVKSITMTRRLRNRGLFLSRKGVWKVR